MVRRRAESRAPIDGQGGWRMHSERDARGRETVRRFLDALPDPPEAPESELPLGTGLPVPPADAATVIDAARSVAARYWHDEVEELPELVRGRLGEEDFSQLCLLADALVIGEHPSAHTWSEQELQRTAAWVAVLMDRLGEDGVQQLISVLTQTVER
ncbi:hypothetical protein GCM10009864_60330 [Streptomyces lunalinharesii]|uniref:Uncharacterized protein n=1 Tax=Streptomyces lunalinharesii TaxID=333384 RepID=A0ABN3SLB6_9ACTN